MQPRLTLHDVRQRRSPWRANRSWWTRFPSPGGNHNAGDVRFGNDGYLYISVGDGGCDWAGNSGCAGANDAARATSTYSSARSCGSPAPAAIPPSNPFQGAGTARCNVTGRTTAGNKCQETFAWGLRNPFRIAFDPNTTATRFFINDVGQGAWEEVDLGVAGADYGWNVREGPCVNGSLTNCGAPPAGMTNPVYSYSHPESGCAAITGGAFVPNGVWPSAYDGTYLYGDYTCGKIFVLTPNGSGGYTRSEFTNDVGAVVNMTFGPSPQGQGLYYTNYSDGGEVRLLQSTAPGNRPPTARMTASPDLRPGSAGRELRRQREHGSRCGRHAHLHLELRRRLAAPDDELRDDEPYLHDCGHLHRDADGARQRRRPVVPCLGPHRCRQHGPAGDDRHPDDRGAIRSRPDDHPARDRDRRRGRCTALVEPQLARASPPRHAHPPVPRADRRERCADHAAGSRGSRFRDRRLSRGSADSHRFARGQDHRDAERPAEEGGSHLLDQSCRPERRPRRHDVHRAEDAHVMGGPLVRGRCSVTDRRFRYDLELPVVVGRRFSGALDRHPGQPHDLHRHVRAGRRFRRPGGGIRV